MATWKSEILRKRRWYQKIGNFQKLCCYQEIRNSQKKFTATRKSEQFTASRRTEISRKHIKNKTFLKKTVLLLGNEKKSQKYIKLLGNQK